MMVYLSTDSSQISTITVTGVSVEQLS